MRTTTKQRRMGKPARRPRQSRRPSRNPSTRPSRSTRSSRTPTRTRAPRPQCSTKRASATGALRCRFPAPTPSSRGGGVREEARARGRRGTRCHAARRTATVPRCHSAVARRPTRGLCAAGSRRRGSASGSGGARATLGQMGLVRMARVEVEVAAAGEEG
ncbi:hypothetical protein B0H11DRAFT_1970825 [Mycena galericulata]|nr:hypothetical protein B0H11DRAFT_1970825 [Mycena galericulata]